MKGRNIIIISLIIGFTGFILFGIYLSPEQTSEIKSNYSENKIIETCYNLTIFETSKCLTKEIGKFYVYNFTDDMIKLSFSQLVNRGGDCKDWSELYLRMAKKLGFYSMYISMEMNKTNNHAVTLISNEDGYCILDQTTYLCERFKWDIILLSHQPLR